MKLKVYHLSKSEWGGCLQPREQDFVVDVRGACMSIPSTYTRHPFKIMEIRYELEMERSENLSLWVILPKSIRSLRQRINRGGGLADVSNAMTTWQYWKWFMKITKRFSPPIPCRGGRCTYSTDVGMWHPQSLHPTTERGTSLILKEEEEKWEFWR